MNTDKLTTTHKQLSLYNIRVYLCLSVVEFYLAESSEGDNVVEIQIRLASIGAGSNVI